MARNLHFRLIIFFALSLVLLVNTYSQTISFHSKDTIGDRPRNTIGIGGIIKLVTTYDYLGLPNGSSFNMYEIPTTNDKKNPSLMFNAWQSRIKIKNNFITKKKEEVIGYIEGDFSGATPGGFRLRYAYVKFKNWTIGQTDSGMSNLDVWVNISDFDGPPVGTWVRQPLIKYTLNLDTNNQFNFSIEDPVLDYAQIDDLDPDLIPTKPVIPDFVFNYRHKFKSGNFQFSSVARVLAYKKNDVRERTLGYGATFSGTFNLFKKDLFIYQGLIGKGIERYLVGLGGYNLDAVPFNNKLEALPVYGGYFGYQHYWNSNLNSSFLYGYQKVENNLYKDFSNPFEGNYYSANLFFDPIENVSFGFEFVYGDRKDINDNSGRNHRAYFTVEYSF